jgi:pimeloyl-ACP methyl ester carboxylesterase
MDLPVLLVNGESDALAPIEEARSWASRMPGATLVEIPDGHHDIVNDSPYRLVEAAIRQFLRQELSAHPATGPTQTTTSA